MILVPRRRGLVRVLENGRSVMRLCVGPVDSVPNADVVLIHKLMIEGDEEKALLRATQRRGLLSAAEEAVVTRRAAAGNEDARRRLVEGNLRFVVKIACEYDGAGVSVEDLVSEGAVGLLKAVAKFDPERGFRFSTYAGCRDESGVHPGDGRQVGKNGQPCATRNESRFDERDGREAETEETAAEMTGKRKRSMRSEQEKRRDGGTEKGA